MALLRRYLRFYLKLLLSLGAALFTVKILWIWCSSSQHTFRSVALSDSLTSSAVHTFITSARQTLPDLRNISSIRERNDARENKTFLLTSASVTSAPNSEHEWSKLMDGVQRVKTTLSLYRFHVKDEEGYYKQPVNSHVHPFSPFLYSPANNCSAYSSLESPFLVVLVLSSYLQQAAKERAAIRATYGSVASGGGGRWPKGKPLAAPVTMLFLLGTPPSPTHRQLVQTESARYGDMLVADFVDSYQNLTLKVLHGLRWVLHHCRQTKFFLKVDDDIFVNLPLLTAFLLTRGQNNSLYGHLYPGGVVHREGRWAVSNKDYPFLRYPLYMAGCAYAISTEAARKILQASSRLPLVPIEDAFITGIVPQLTDVQKMGCSGFTYFIEKKSEVCDFVNDIRLMGNKMHSADKRSLWTALELADSNLCSA